MLADGNGDCAQAVGLTMDGKAVGMGTRGQRYSMIVNDAVVEQLNVEAPGEFKVSRAHPMPEQHYGAEKPLIFRGGAPRPSGVGVTCGRIGSEAGTEGVCQYVKLAVVAVACT